MAWSRVLAFSRLVSREASTPEAGSSRAGRYGGDAFAMTDIDKPSFHHGGGKVAYAGQAAVPCGVFASGFTGPSPPGVSATYQFTIQALGANGAVLATTTARRKFPQSRPPCSYNAATALTSIRNSSRTKRSMMSSVLGG